MDNTVCELTLTNWLHLGFSLQPLIHIMGFLENMNLKSLKVKQYTDTDLYLL